MKLFFRSIFSPILKIFESGTEAYEYKPLNRKLLIFAGVLFGGLSAALFIVWFRTGNSGALLPGGIFAVVSLVAEVVGILGNERAVSKIWGNR